MPTSIPRTRNVLTMAGSLCQSVAGKAEKVAAVVHELMHIRPTNEGSGTLLRAHKIDRQQKNKPRENRPWEPLTQRYCGGRASWCVCSVCHNIVLPDSQREEGQAPGQRTSDTMGPSRRCRPNPSRSSSQHRKWNNVVKSSPELRTSLKKPYPGRSWLYPRCRR
jgi:hypothetical protein